MAATRRLKELIASTLAKLELPDGSITVGLSGGADSAALAYLAIETGADVHLVHVHHGYAASDSLAEAAGVIADRLDLSLEIVRVEVEPGPSPEGQARHARYEVFHSIEGPVVTAHTREDSVETMLINLIRGTGVDGLSGIPYHRPPNVYRPILEITRSETRELAELAGLGFLDDPMNADVDLTRNRVRYQIIPQMRELNPRVEEAMARTARSLRADSDFLEAQTPPAAGNAISVGLVTTLPPTLADRLLRRWLTGQDVAVSSHLLERVWSVARGDARGQDLEGGRRVTRDRAVLRLE